MGLAVRFASDTHALPIPRLCRSASVEFDQGTLSGGETGSNHPCLSKPGSSKQSTFLPRRGSLTGRVTFTRIQPSYRMDFAWAPEMWLFRVRTADLGDSSA